MAKPLPSPVTYRALAAFLCYPDADVQAAAPAAMAVIRAESGLPAHLVSALEKLAGELAAGDLLTLQERYVRLFDRTRSLSLNLYEHVHGESRERGQAMAALLALYRSRGLELSSRELPDHLPVFLDFLATQPANEAASLLAEAAHVLEALAERLKKRASNYRAVFGALVQLAGERADREALRALLAEPDEDPDDLERIDKAWMDEPVNFGPGEAGCPKAESFIRQMNKGV
ncbi:nitrate reductase molybdenum cofactor assembly chaperone [Pseudochelatococcus lubricantis]|uniref:nitrate reductase molybdenum cofactor assembly chaperone n=1 Tax=Pseudochelatococcus lubricantis TaxID=1538102 RepID=UPI0035E70181